MSDGTVYTTISAGSLRVVVGDTKEINGTDDNATDNTIGVIVGSAVAFILVLLMIVTTYRRLNTSGGADTLHEPMYAEIGDDQHPHLIEGLYNAGGINVNQRACGYNYDPARQSILHLGTTKIAAGGSQSIFYDSASPTSSQCQGVAFVPHADHGHVAVSQPPPSYEVPTVRPAVHVNSVYSV